MRKRELQIAICDDDKKYLHTIGRKTFKNCP